MALLEGEVESDLLAGLGRGGLDLERRVRVDARGEGARGAAGARDDERRREREDLRVRQGRVVRGREATEAEGRLEEGRVTGLDGQDRAGGGEVCEVGAVSVNATRGGSNEMRRTGRLGDVGGGSEVGGRSNTGRKNGSASASWSARTSGMETRRTPQERARSG